MEEKQSTGQALPDSMLLGEANLARLGGQLEEAEVLLLDFVASRELTAEAANLLSIVYGEAGKNEDQIYYAKEAVEKEPGNAIFVGNYGCVLAADAKTKNLAIARIRHALSIDPDLEYLYEWLGDVCRRDGDEETALREFRQAIQVSERKCHRNPTPVTEWHDLARLYHKVGDYEQMATARSRLEDAKLNEVYEGDHRHQIAGPDSGFLTST